MQNRQVFAVQNPIRWRILKFSFIASAAFLSFLIVVVVYSFFSTTKASLPKYTGFGKYVKLSELEIKDTSAILHFDKDINIFRKQYRADFYKNRRFTDEHPQLNEQEPEQIRAAFYVNWDIQSFLSFKEHAKSINLFLPQICFLDDTVPFTIDSAGKIPQVIAIARRNNIPIMPVLSNLVNQQWDGELVKNIIRNKQRKKALIDAITYQLLIHQFQGINIDFEDLNESTDSYLVSFIHELGMSLHQHQLKLGIDIEPFNADYNTEELAKDCDYLFLMAYDEHSATTTAGYIASQQYVDASLDAMLKNVPEEKVVLCLAAYGYDWPKGFQGNNISYEEAITTAAESDTFPHFNNNTYNLNYTYWDEKELEHEVYFTDAATTFNHIRTAGLYGIGGVALWRLGSEDKRIWQFYSKSFSPLVTDSLPHLVDAFVNIPAVTSIDYQGGGEILDLVSSPKTGNIDLEFDSTDWLIAEEYYRQLPTGYVIKKTGEKDMKVVLTFDDGPDDNYTRKILKILKEKNVPAAFFITGVNAEANIPLLREIYKDGYEIGNHTFTHANLAATSDTRTFLELRSTRRLMEAITGHTTILFRPPYSTDAESTTPEELHAVAVAKQDNYLYVGASIDTRDWEADVTSDIIYNRAVAQKDLGNIILLHDAGGKRDETIKALPRIIDTYQKMGYTFTTLSDLMDKKKEDLMPALQSGKDSWFANTIVSFANLVYWQEHFFYIAFIVALLLVMSRMLLLGWLAIRKKIQLNKSSEPILGDYLPLVSVIIPAYNEEINVVSTVKQLLLSSYKNTELIVVDDGSTDNTLMELEKHFSTHSKVTLLTHPNSGKASAINLGIRNAKGTLLFCIDADTLIDVDAIAKMVPLFENPTIGAAAGNVKVGNKINMVTRWQHMEYVSGQNFDRYAFDSVNAIMVVPGAIGMFKKEAVEEAGLFTTDTLAEDCDLTIKLLALGYTVTSCNTAIARTEVPNNMSMLFKQRKRWTFGVMQSFWKHKYLLFNLRRPNIGWYLLPNILLFQMLLPLLAPFVDLVLLFSILFGNSEKTLLLFLLYTVLDAAIVRLAFLFDDEPFPFKLILTLITQRFIYRQLLFFVIIISYLRALRGEIVHWGFLKRTGLTVGRVDGR